ncbi:MAG: diaminopimelate epimerase [Desulfobacterales bacterium]|nr:MAG: diaminopimelate epimerase [Desulfobacterales bacterium]
MNERIPFYKMSGSGNDFVFIDNRNGRVPPEGRPELARAICIRRLGVGADGLVLIEAPANGADFRWDFYNSDGSAPEMCGNAARCATRFARLHGIGGDRLCFETAAGLIHAELEGERARVRLTDPGPLTRNQRLSILPDEGAEKESGDAGPLLLSADHIDTGVPHAVIRVPDIDAVDIRKMGAAVRFHEVFAPAGANVNFISPAPGGRFFCRTYERGVEDETLACGTGCAAAALILAAAGETDSPVDIIPRSGGVLRIHFTRADAGFTDIWLEGDARIVYTGEMTMESWNW